VDTLRDENTLLHANAGANSCSDANVSPFLNNLSGRLSAFQPSQGGKQKRPLTALGLPYYHFGLKAKIGTTSPKSLWRETAWKLPVPTADRPDGAA